MTDPAEIGPASARVWCDSDLELQVQILRRLDRIIELLSQSTVKVDLDTTDWFQGAKVALGPTSTRADDTH